VPQRAHRLVRPPRERPIACFCSPPFPPEAERCALIWNVSFKPQDFRLISGKDELGDYQFNTKQGHHRFCKLCSIASFGDSDVKEIGGAYVAISVACLDDVSSEVLAKLPIKYMDGRHDNWFEQPKVTSYL
jgi:hypothetical protein